MTAHEFTPAEDDWGFFQLAAHENIQSRKKELYPDGSLHIRVTFTVRYRALQYSTDGIVLSDNQRMVLTNLEYQ